MRGKVTFTNNKLSHIRITPAYAGKSIWTTRYYEAGEDHPRLCGEK